MIFPRKKPSQQLIGYLGTVLNLVEGEFANGIPMTEIHQQINEQAGFTNGYGYFALALHKARKRKADGVPAKEFGAAGAVREPTKHEPPLGGNGGRSFEYQPAHGQDTLDKLFLTTKGK